MKCIYMMVGRHFPLQMGRKGNEYMIYTIYIITFILFPSVFLYTTYVYLLDLFKYNLIHYYYI